MEEDSTADIAELLIAVPSPLTFVLAVETVELEVVTGAELEDTITGTEEDVTIVLSLEEVK